MMHLNLWQPIRTIISVSSRILGTRGIQLRHYSILKVIDFLPDKLAPKCRSCGINLQDSDKSKPGYYIKEKILRQPYNKKKLDDVYASALKKLDQEDKSLLANGAELFIEGKLPKQNKKNADEKPVTKGNSSDLECLRCRHVKFQLKFDSEQFPIDPPSQIMEQVPPWANLVYVVSAQDFPMSLEKKVFEFWPAKQIQFVITKADLFFPSNKAAQDKGLPFFQDYLQRTYKVSPEQVFLVSGHVNWGVSKFLKDLKDDSFFIGSVNSGKSTLLQSLIFVLHAKNGNDKISIENKLGFAASQRQRIKNIDKFKEQCGPGVSYMPGFTRNVIPFELSPGKTVFDVPGFDGTESGKLPEILLDGSMKKLQQGQKFHKRGTYLSRYETAKQGQCITIGGLFFLSVPNQSMYRIRSLVNHPVYIFKNHNKAMECWGDMENLPALKDVFLLKKTDLVKYQIPPFVGSIDLVFKNFGYITITATGAMPEPNPPVYIYLPKYVTACVRAPISQYITKTLSGRDNKGRILPKEEWVTKSTKETKRYVGHEPLTRNLIWIGEDFEDSGELETS